MDQRRTRQKIWNCIKTEHKPERFDADNVYRFDSVGVSRTSFVSVGDDESFPVVSFGSPSLIAVVAVELLLLLLLLNVDDEVDGFVGFVVDICVDVVNIVDVDALVGFVFAAVDDVAGRVGSV